MTTFKISPMASLVGLACASATGLAQAQQEIPPDIAEVAGPGTSVSVGVEAASGGTKDRARFGMFNGLRDRSTNLLLGFSYRNHGQNGTWTDVAGRNLTLDNRELDFSYRRLGDLKFSGGYSEITRHDPRTINTGVTGFGTTTPTVNILATPGTGQDYNLELKRKALSLGLDKWISGNWQLETSFKTEDKDGARLWGRGFGCSTLWVAAGTCTTTGGAAILALAEPVDSTHRQAEAKLNFTGERLNLSMGYYGSFYTNRNGNLTPGIPAGTRWGGQNGGTPLTLDTGLNGVMGTPMALWPDNQAHQFSLAGNYKLTKSTKLNFKYSYTRATQDESFSGMGLPTTVARNDLGGRLDITKLQVGFSSHVLPKLHVHGDVKYDEKKNKTPIATYNAEPTCNPGTYSSATRACTAGNTVTGSYTNNNMSPKKYDAKLEAAYQLTPQYTAIAGVKYEHEDYDTWTQSDYPGGISALRQKLNETGWWVEMRRMMSDTFTGAVAYHQERRKGDSPWLTPVAASFQQAGGSTGVVQTPDATIYANGGGTSTGKAIIPFIYMNRDRDKIRLTGNWEATEKLSLQVFWDQGIDRYFGPTDHGLRAYRMGTLSLDASYAINDSWKASMYGSRGVQRINSGHSTGYDADYTDTSYAFGAGLRGQVSGPWRVGGDLTMIFDKLEYNQSLDASNTSATNTAAINAGGLPDVVYRLARLNLYSEYAVQKNAFIRLDFIRHLSFFNEWTYVGPNGQPFLYSDNSTITAQERQSVYVIGASFVYKF